MPLTSIQSTLTSPSTFSELIQQPALLRAIADRGYTTPSPIQSQSIPYIKNGDDVLATSQTGTGKTAAFMLPILEQLCNTIPNRDPSKTRPTQVLVLAPTRELAEQIDQSTRKYAAHLSIRSVAIFGGVSPQPQVKSLEQGVDIVIATPGRLLDLLEQRPSMLSQIEFFVLDEADRMLDLGFIRDIQRIKQHLPPQPQTLLFSATINDGIQELSQDFLNQPQIVKCAIDNSAAQTVVQEVFRVDKSDKASLLRSLLHSEDWQQVLVFTRTKFGAEKLWNKLQDKNISSVAIHGDKTQAARQKALKQFKQGKAVVLVATDVAARGLDIQGLDHVVNFEMPNVPQDYIHRIGRTGRAGRAGHAVSFACHEEERFLRRIEKLIGKEIPEFRHPDFQMTHPDEIVVMDLAPHETSSKKNKSSQRSANPKSKRSKSAPNSASPASPEQTSSPSKSKAKKSKGKKVKLQNPMKAASQKKKN